MEETKNKNINLPYGYCLPYGSRCLVSRLFLLIKHMRRKGFIVLNVGLGIKRDLMKQGLLT